MASAASLVVDLQANSAAFIASMEKARAAVESVGFRVNSTLAGIERSFRRVQNVAGTFGVALSAAAAVRFGANLVSSIGDLGDLADGLGVSTDALQAYQAVARTSGVAFDTLQNALANIGRRAGEAAQGSADAIRSFNAIGVSVLDANGNVRTLENLLPDVAAGILSMGDANTRAAVAADLLGGKLTRAMVPALTDLATPIDALIAKSAQLGVLIDNRVIKGAKEAGDAAAITGMKLKAGLANLPVGGFQASDTTRRDTPGANPLSEDSRKRVADLQLEVNESRLLIDAYNGIGGSVMDVQRDYEVLNTVRATGVDIMSSEYLRVLELANQQVAYAAQVSDLKAAHDGLNRDLSELARGGISTMLDAFKQMGREGTLSFETLGQAALSVLDSIIEKVMELAIINPLLNSLGLGGGAGGGALPTLDLGGLFGGLFADGGRPPLGKASIVGERGPELFVPDTAGTVVPAGAWGGAGGDSYHFNFTTGLQGAIRAELVNFMPTFRRQAESAVADAKRRGAMKGFR